MKRRASVAVLAALVASGVAAPVPVAASTARRSPAVAEPCPTYDLASLFYDDYYGTVWTAPGASRTLRWTPFATTVHTEAVTRPFSEAELALVREAFAAWDVALDSIALEEVAGDAVAEITIGWTPIVEMGTSVDGYWNGWWGGDRIRTRATIRMRSSSAFLAAGGAGFKHGVMHELGNVLGMGDIRPRDDIESTQEDPWQQPYGPAALSAFDRAVIRQMYGESTCPASAATDPLVTSPVVVHRIRCARGSKVRVVTGPDPTCPKGFRQRGRRTVVRP